MRTVNQLIEELNKYPSDMEVVFANGYGRKNEFNSIVSVKSGTISEQNNDGDPEYRDDERKVVIIRN